MMQRNNDSDNSNNQNNNNGSGSHPACASCKHQRKKCGEDCILAPYFPADKTREFQAVHKIFGVSNTMKLVRDVQEEERKLTAESLIWEAVCWQNNPVLGPRGEYRKLEEELELCKNQMRILKQNLSQVQAMQSTGSLMYKPPSGGPVGWTSRTGMGGELANNMVNYGHDNGNIIIETNAYNYPFYMQAQDKLVKENVGVGSQLLVPRQLQQHSVSGCNQRQQQYHLPGQFGSIHGKTDHNSRGPL